MAPIATSDGCTYSQLRRAPGSRDQHLRMGDCVGETTSAVLPQAFGAAISPIPIIAVILMLFSSRARVNGPVFVIGWVLGLLIVAGIAYLVGDNQDADGNGSGSDWVFVLKIVLGVLLFLLAIRQWRSRPNPDEPPKPPPTWMQAIDQFSPIKAFGMAALLSGLNPKNLLLSIAAGVTIAQRGATGVDAWVAIIVYA
jgi:threonine/homoserine/homoserine lactone efflux protein